MTVADPVTRLAGAVMAGAGCGIWLYGKLDDAAFRRIILILLLASGLSLVGSVLLRTA